MKLPLPERYMQSQAIIISRPTHTMSESLTTHSYLLSNTSCSATNSSQVSLCKIKSLCTSSPMVHSQDTEVNALRISALAWTVLSGPYLALLTKAPHQALTIRSSSGTHSSTSGTLSKEEVESRLQPTTKSQLQSSQVTASSMSPPTLVTVTIISTSSIKMAPTIIPYQPPQPHPHPHLLPHPHLATQDSYPILYSCQMPPKEIGYRVN